jgi:prepilin-type N-terminal cleavage/methylation domain-containing protein
MKRAFTLIELLVVIAIIAILAAILFPVFAQAKQSAKKTAGISNQKQIGLAIVQYCTDFDDLYPRNDGCALNSSLNPALNNKSSDPSPWCNGSQGYAFRLNHYSWQKWMMPYTKNVDLFMSPYRQKFDDRNNSTGFRQWSENGQIMGAFALNLALTGAINTWNRADTAAGRLRNSWLGGTQNAVPDVSQAMLLFDFSHTDINFAPVVFETAQSSNSVQEVYPAAFREFWGRILNKWTTCSGPYMNEISSEADPRSTITGGIILGFCDGSAKFMQSNRFLARTPLAAEYVALPTSNACGKSSGTIVPGAKPNLAINYPMWGLGN